MRCYGDKPASFLAKVPRGLLPVIELDGQVMTESAEIMKVLEYEFQDVPLLPPETNRIRYSGMPVHFLDFVLTLLDASSSWLRHVRQGSNYNSFDAGKQKIFWAWKGNSSLHGWAG